MQTSHACPHQGKPCLVPRGYVPLITDHVNLVIETQMPEQHVKTPTRKSGAARSQWIFWKFVEALVLLTSLCPWEILDVAQIEKFKKSLWCLSEESLGEKLLEEDDEMPSPLSALLLRTPLLEGRERSREKFHCWVSQVLFRRNNY